MERGARRGRESRRPCCCWSVGFGDGRASVRLQGHVLAPVGEAKTLRVRGGEVEIDDGPVAESDAQISGFNILDCADLDEALEVASKHPVAKFGTLELRAFVES